MHDPSTTAAHAASRRIQPRAACAVACALAAGSAQAYIDPNAGGLLYQVLFPLLVAVAAGWRYVRMAVANLWSRLTGRRQATPRPPATPEDDQ